ncbi:Coatomer subunit, alpha (CopA) [Carpediemonas membranifera]|uniref:Coatomer subunit, alpha (CopA) n=1 Tax=Carpediemonas membranifera TaxID=201153 RepID=A0A8J6B0L0_9EUKA|nr:Coatomer subunit, alpha (CopA) [Carpediemonas membranifera]|eukprot:KAG9391699.1 Coatomer subunit, alpha (CopA) [Carpediemonas membranifera]
MLTKLETRSSRVKGVDFHPKRPFVIVSLHNGLIQIWDTTVGTLVDTFNEHNGPVRGIHFHPSQSLFVSGGDDSKIKVWDYKKKRCLYTLVGHTDYIRTTFFHPEMPWIVSASDDQTVRIWNWQSRELIADLVGHNHWVMCAAFHPSDMYVASASLDMTVRVWNISQLRKRQSQNAIQSIAMQVLTLPMTIIASSVIGYGHGKGLNWVSWHPDEPRTLITTSDDQSVRIWRHSTVKDGMLFPVATLFGHSHNVTCARYVNKAMIISTGEDGSVRFYDAKKKTVIDERKMDSRVWVAACHPSRNLIAIGHDSGLTVMATNRERPAFCVSTDGETVFYVQHQKFISRSLTTDADQLYRGDFKPQFAPKGMFGAGKVRMYPSLLQITEKPGSDTPFPLILNYTGPSGSLFDVLHDDTKAIYQMTAASSAILISGSSGAPEHLAVLEEGNTQRLRLYRYGSTGLQPERGDVIKLESSGRKLCPAGPGEVVVIYDDSVELIDCKASEHRRAIAISGARRLTWTPDFEYAAIQTKNSITVVDRRFSAVCSMRDHIRIKGATWSCPVGNSNTCTTPSRQRVVIFATLTHVKYLLLDGEVGVLTSINRPVYPVAMVGSKFWYIDRHHHLHALALDTTIMAFQFAVLEERDADIRTFARKCLAVETGTAIVSYLYRKGRADIALAFARTARIKFPLAIECKDLATASSVADHLASPKAFSELAQLAMSMGSPAIAAEGLDKGGRSSVFIRTVAGAPPATVDPADPIGSIVAKQGDITDLLKASGLHALAAAAAFRRGQTPETSHVPAVRIAKIREFTANFDGRSTLTPLEPVIDPEAAMQDLPSVVHPVPFLSTLDTAASEDTGLAGDWEDDLELSDDDEEETPAVSKPAPAKAKVAATPNAGGWDDDDLDLSDEDEDEFVEGPSGGAPCPLPAEHPFMGRAIDATPVELFAMGKADAALARLAASPVQAHVSNKEVREVIRMAAVSSTVFISGAPIPLADPDTLPLNSATAAPRVPFTDAGLANQLESAHQDVCNIGNNVSVEQGVAQLDAAIARLRTVIVAHAVIHPMEKVAEDSVPAKARNLIHFCILDRERRSATDPMDQLRALSYEAFFVSRQMKDWSPLTTPIVKLARNDHFKACKTAELWPYVQYFSQALVSHNLSVADKTQNDKVRAKAGKKLSEPGTVQTYADERFGIISQNNGFFNAAEPLEPLTLQDDKELCPICGTAHAAGFHGECVCGIDV